MNTKRVELLLTNKAILILILLTVTVFGCSSGPNFVVSRDVPAQPSFIVVPASTYPDQIEYADRFEGYLLAAGIRVLVTPAVRENLTIKEGSQMHAEDNVLSEARSVVFEWSDAVKSSATYILSTDSEFSRVKIIRRDGGEILASFQLKTFTMKAGEEERRFREALVALGLHLK